MIRKDKLLDQISALISQEKGLVPLLNRHISSALFFSRLKDSDRDTMIQHFQDMVVMKTGHIEILNGIKDQLTRSDNDVY